MSYHDQASTQIHICTESGFGTGNPGNQIDKFKLNLSQAPIQAEDDAVLKLTLNSFQYSKNHYDINPTNNAVRVVFKDLDHYDDFDVIVKLTSCDVTNINMLADLFRHVLGVQIKSAQKAGVIGLVQDATNKPNKSGFKFVSSSTDAVIQSKSDDNINLNKFEIVFQAPLGQDFGGTGSIIAIQCLQIPPNDPNLQLQVATGNITNTEAFNNSYLLLGGKRVETFELISATMTQSFTIALSNTAIDNDTLTITGTYPMNQTCNTLPYLYLRLEGGRNQSTSNMVALEEQHTHEVTYSQILGKVPRTINSVQEVEYKLENSSTYFTLLNTKILNSLTWSVVDQHGRSIPPTDSAGDQKLSGNMIINFSITIEKLKIPFSPARLNLPVPIQPPLKETYNLGYINPL